MAITGNNFIVSDKYEQVAEVLFKNFGDVSKVEQIPADIIIKVFSHPDYSDFISDSNPMIELSGIVGPYTIYDETMSFLCRVNLHQGVFGATFLELDYISKMPQYSIIYVHYLDKDGMHRDIQIIKKD